MPLCVAAEDPPPLGELGPLPFPLPPGRDVAPLAPFAPPGVRDPAATASFTFAKASDPRVAYPVASTPAPTAATPTPLPTPTRSPPLIEATPPSIADEILGDIQQTQRNITAAAAKSKAVRAASGELPIVVAICAHPWESVIPAPIRR